MGRGGKRRGERRRRLYVVIQPLMLLLLMEGWQPPSSPQKQSSRCFKSTLGVLEDIISHNWERRRESGGLFTWSTGKFSLQEEAFKLGSRVVFKAVKEQNYKQLLPLCAKVNTLGSWFEGIPSHPAPWLQPTWCECCLCLSWIRDILANYYQGLLDKFWHFIWWADEVSQALRNALSSL